jgi:type I restriction-modification system DNA methylase subunit
MTRNLKTVTKQKATGAHFTPPELAAFVARRILKAYGGTKTSHLRVLDPSCGEGELLVALASQLTEKQLRQTTIIGIESDGSSLAKTKERLQHFHVNKLEMIKGDFLEIAQLTEQPQLSLTDDTLNSLDNVDIIIANPPYVRTQILGAKRAQQLAEIFSITGRVDLYQAFLVAMTSQLAPDGVLGVITSNRFLTTKGGGSTRSFLNKKYSIREIYDLGDTKFFSAAVLPAVFVGTRKQLNAGQNNGTTSEFLRIYEKQFTNNNSIKDCVSEDSIVNVLERHDTGMWQVGKKCYTVSVGELRIPQISSAPWMMVTNTERKWLEKIDQNAYCRISDVTKVRVGIKTTSDKVYIKQDWDELPQQMIPEQSLLHPLLSHEQTGKWQKNADKTQRRVLYPHEMFESKRRPVDLQKYPKAGAYLEHHRDSLEKRTYVIKAGRQWYEIWVPQNPSSWRYPKIVFPDISPVPKFCLDTDSNIVDGNCYWITFRETKLNDLLLLILGVANSSILTQYHDLAFNNKLYAGRRRYLTQYVEKYPLPDPKGKEAKKIITAVKKLLSENGKNQIKKLESEIETQLKIAFDIN